MVPGAAVIDNPERRRSIQGLKGLDRLRGTAAELFDPCKRIETYAKIMVVFLLGGIIGSTWDLVYELVAIEEPVLAGSLIKGGIRLAFLLPVLVLWYLVRGRRVGARTALALACLLQVLLMYSTAWFDTGDLRVLTTGPSWDFLWMCVFIILFPLIVLAPVWLHALVATTCAFAFLVWNQIFAAIGLASLELPQVLDLTFHALLCAGIAMIASSALNRLGKVLAIARDEAREMGSYQLIERLGRGGMGEVWRGQHRMLARPAAIKLIKPNAFPGEVEEIIKRFEREAKATAQLSSAHTVSLYDFGHTDNGEFYYVMELLDGMDLETMVKRFGALPPERVAYLFRQICASLAEAHRAGMIHRDIKPANIFVCRNGVNRDFVKVLDFGLVMHHQPQDAEQAIRLTQRGMVNGTPEYMSPEHIMDSDTIDHRSDIYSLGCVAYWCLTADTVFQASDTGKMLRKHIEEPPLPLDQHPSSLGIPTQLSDLVMRCLHKDPGQRPQSCLELANLLTQIRTEEPWTQARAIAWWKNYLTSAISRPTSD